MQVSRDFTIAIHILLCVDYFGKDTKVTSDFIASSVGINPVIVRRMFAKLKDANLIEVNAGTGGVKIIPKKKEISLYDIYVAAGCKKNDIFNFHENPNLQCPVGKNIHKVLDPYIKDATKALENELKKTTFSELCKELK